jgi:hypothetical protein
MNLFAVEGAGRRGYRGSPMRVPTVASASGWVLDDYRDGVCVMLEARGRQLGRTLLDDGIGAARQARVGFVGFRPPGARQSRAKSTRTLDFCWISRLLEHTFARGRSSKVVRSFTLWAVTGSNRRPLRCKGGSGEFVYQRKCVSLQFRAAFRVVSVRPS